MASLPDHASAIADALVAASAVMPDAGAMRSTFTVALRIAEYAPFPSRTTSDTGMALPSAPSVSVAALVTPGAMSIQLLHAAAPRRSVATATAAPVDVAEYCAVTVVPVSQPVGTVRLVVILSFRAIPSIVPRSTIEVANCCSSYFEPPTTRRSSSSNWVVV